MQIPILFSPQTPVRLACTLLMAASAGFGSLYAWTTGSQHGVILGGLSLAMALGLELAKPFATHLAFTAARSKLWGSAAAMSVLAFVAIAFSLTSELSLIAQTRGDLAAERAAQVEPVTLAKEDRARALSELQMLGAVRTTGEVEAELAKAKVNPRWRKSSGCLDVTLTATADFCGGVQSLQAELSRAKRAEQLKEELATSSAVIAAASSTGHGVVSSADPGASALSSYLAALGVGVQPETVSRWLILVPVLALELGSTLSVLAMSLVSSPTPVPTADRVHPPAPTQKPPGQRASVQRQQQRRPAPTAPVGPAASSVLNLLAGSGGQLQLGQRAIGKALGISKSRVGQVLHQLAKEGAVVLNAGRSGTMVALPTMA